MSLLRDRHVDSLRIKFGSPDEPLARGDARLDGILEIIESDAGDLTPDKIRISRSRTARYSRAGAHKRLRREQPPERTVWLERSHLPEAEMGFYFSDAGPDHFSLEGFAAPLDFFADEAKAQHVVSLIRSLSHAYQPLAGFAHSSADYSLFREEARSQRCDTEPWALEEIFWLNVLGKGLVKKVGRKRALATPAEHLEELPNGSILFLTRLTPKDFNTEQARVAQAKALVHLRPELSYTKTLEKLHARSAVLVPVEPRWAPDVAPFFAELAKEAHLIHLHPLTARLNALELPPVSEWFPLDAAPPSDVDDPAEAIQRYEGKLAEGIIAGLHTKVPELLKERPESLPKLDSHIYRYGLPELMRANKAEEWFISASGAYLGMLMVKHLGGRWVPRQRLEEAQVIVGDRAFLPFLRARHNLANKESPLQYSLSQLYRFAARHLVERALAGEHAHPGIAEASRPPRA